MAIRGEKSFFIATFIDFVNWIWTNIKKVNISKEELIYSIIDQQAVNPDIIKETKSLI